MAWAAANGCRALLRSVVGAMRKHRRAMLPGAIADKAARRAVRGRRYKRFAVTKSKWAKRGPGMLVAQRRLLT